MPLLNKRIKTVIITLIKKKVAGSVSPQLSASVFIVCISLSTCSFLSLASVLRGSDFRLLSLCNQPFQMWAEQYWAVTLRRCPLHPAPIPHLLHTPLQLSPYPLSQLWSPVSLRLKPCLLLCSCCPSGHTSDRVEPKHGSAETVRKAIFFTT